MISTAPLEGQFDSFYRGPLKDGRPSISAPPEESGLLDHDGCQNISYFLIE